MGNKKYFAFISYKREDEEWAKWFQNELENYHLPSTLNGRTDISEILEEIPESFRPPKKEFRPVFRDIDELKAGNLPEQIYNALQDSLNLVVICSHRLADDEEAKWVNKEIHDFIDIGEKEGTDNIKNIFPFIVDGVPHAGDERECFPKVLRELSTEQERIGGNVNEGGNVSDENRERAFVKVLAGMLPQSVSFDMLWDRYDRDKKAREVREKEQRDSLLIAQSRFIAEKANQLVDEGDSYLASILSLKALPSNIKIPDRPYVLEAEAALRKSLRKDNAFLLGHSHSVISSIYSKDGNRIYSVSWDKKICAWDALSGRLITSKQKHTKPINSIALSQDASMLATASEDKSVILWDSKSLKQLGKPILYNSAVNYVSFSQCGKYILAALSDDCVCLSDLEGTQIIHFSENSDYDLKAVFQVYMIGVSQIVTSSFDGAKVWEWDKESNTVKLQKCLVTEDMGLKVQSMNYCPKTNILVFGQGDVLYLWSLSDYRLIKSISFSTMITAHAINEDENQIAVACYDYLYLIGIPKEGQSWSKATLVSRYECGISYLSFSPNKKKSLLLSFSNGPIRLLDIDENKSVKETSIKADSISFISNDSFVVASSQDVQPGVIYDIKLCTRETLIPEDVMRRINEHYGISYEDYNQIMFNRKGKNIYCLKDGKIYVYNMCKKKGERQSINFLSHYRCCFKAISKDGRRALYAFKDGTMFLVDAITGKRIKLLEKTDNHSLIHSACFSSDSKLIATTSNEGKVRVYNAMDGTLIQRMKPIQTLWGNSIEFSRKGDMIICSSQDYYVYIWEFDKDNKLFKLKRRLSGHEERVCCASFSSDGKMAVSASPGKIIVWDVESGVPLEIIELDTKGYDLNFVKFNPDDSRIFVSRGGKLTIIEFPKLQKLINVTRKRFRNRQLSELEQKRYYLE